MTLVARTIAVDGTADLIGFAGTDGLLCTTDGAGLAGRGEALRIELPSGLADVGSVADALAGIEVEHDDVGVAGTGPVAMGALPFDRFSPATMVVPRQVLGRSADGTAWLTTIGHHCGRRDEPSPPPTTAASPSSFRLTSRLSHEAWCERVDEALAAIAAGDFEKVVLAREVEVEADTAIPLVAVLRRLESLYPSCTVFSVDGFVGASPELLVERRGDHVRSHPLAGTYPRSGDPAADDALAASLQQSDKDNREHRWVVDAVQEALAPLCSKLVVPERPSILPLRNVLHLGTEIEGVLRHHPTALELVARLHPTPAVGGAPAEAALRWLVEHEGMERGRYAGPVGWVDADGDGSFVIGIRSAEIAGRTARLFAGVGLVDGSVPESELAETQLKLQALLAAVVRP